MRRRRSGPLRRFVRGLGEVVSLVVIALLAILVAVVGTLAVLWLLRLFLVP